MGINDQIKHIVHVMLENRGFDSVLGYLYDKGDLPARTLPADPTLPVFDGLAFVDDRDTLINRYAPLGLALAPSLTVRASNSPGTGPHEDWEHVNAQLYGHLTAPGPDERATMTGFLADYATLFTKPGDHRGALAQIMKVYASIDLPVLSALARGYAVSDRWFSSVPSQTNANRAFSVCGTSMGLVDNGFLVPDGPGKRVKVFAADDEFKTRTLFNVLADNHHREDFRIFWTEKFPYYSPWPYTRNVFPYLDQIRGPNHDKDPDDLFIPIAKFEGMARTGTLPRFSYLEPSWSLGRAFQGTDYHPPGDVHPGEQLLRTVYQALRANPAWNQTLLIITFDEHGGTYDHVAPPTNARPPWGDGPPPRAVEHDFDFRRFGVRVPAILVSPLIEARTVFRSPTDTPFDHTSVIATVLDWFGVPREGWSLGDRVAHAPTFGHLITQQPPRTDDVLADPPPPSTGAQLSYGAPFVLLHESRGQVTRAGAGPTTQYSAPRIGVYADPIHLEFHLCVGPLCSGQTVQLRSREQVLGKLHTLGVFSIGFTTQVFYTETDDSDDFAGQKWRVDKVGGKDGDCIVYGDGVVFHSLGVIGSTLVRRKDRLDTAQRRETWFLEPPESELERGPELRFGAPFYLRNDDGRYLWHAEKTMPRMRREGAVRLLPVGAASDHGAVVTTAAQIQLKTTQESLVGNVMLASTFAERNCLYTVDDRDDAGQVWRMVKQDTTDNKLRYGDRVSILNLSRGQRLIADDDAMNGGAADLVRTVSGGADLWILEEPLVATHEAIRYGDRVVLQFRYGETNYVVSAALALEGTFMVPQLNTGAEVSFTLIGGIGPIHNGGVVKVRSPEALSVVRPTFQDNVLVGKRDNAQTKKVFYDHENRWPTEELWRLKRADDEPSPLRYGQQISIVHVASNLPLLNDTRSAYLLTLADLSTSKWRIFPGVRD